MALVHHLGCGYELGQHTELLFLQARVLTGRLVTLAITLSSCHHISFQLTPHIDGEL